MPVSLMKLRICCECVISKTSYNEYTSQHASQSGSAMQCYRRLKAKPGLIFDGSQGPNPMSAPNFIAINWEMSIFSICMCIYIYIYI